MRRLRPSRLSSLAFAALLALSLAIPATAATAASPVVDPLPSKGPFPVAGTLSGVRVEPVVSGLSAITGITNSGDGRLFVTLQAGRILVLVGDVVKPQPFLDISSLLRSGGEQGLLSVAFHPRFHDNGFFFVDYTDRNGDTVIARYQVSSNPDVADPASGRILLTIDQPFDNHNGGQLQFGPDGYLYIGMGDGGSAFDPACRAQKPGELLGKLLRIDVDQNVAVPPYYGIPADNPFRGPGDPADEIWATGLRNPWRFSFDRQTGDLWIGDVGQNRREEIDFQPAGDRGGENYGWKVMEGTLCSTTDACPAGTPACNSAAFTDPVLEYDHDPHCSVTGGYVYRGSGIPQIRGTYFFGDFCSGVVWAASRQGSGFTVRTLSDRVGTLSTFGEDQNGELYLGTNDGRIFRLAGTGNPPPPAATDTVGLFDAQTSTFQLKTANTTAAQVRNVGFGPRRNRWTPIAGDWNGDGKSTPGFWDPAASVFRLKNSLSGGNADVVLRVDSPSSRALPVVGDWDGNGTDTVGLYDPATGTFYLKNSLAGRGFDVTVRFGPVNPALLPLAGDWDGDGTDGIGVFNPAGGLFVLSQTADGTPDLQFAFGPARGQLPVAGDWNGDGTDGIGVYDPTTANFRLRNTASAGAPEIQFRFGPRRNNLKPLAGAW